MLGPGVVPQNSLRSPCGRTPFKQLRQARSRSACVLRHTHPPQALRFSAQPEGVGSGDKDGCCFAAAPGVGSRCALPTCEARPPWRAERSEGPQAERSNGPKGARSHPLLTVPRSAGPGVSACRRTRASLSSLPQLSERSSKNAASSAAHPRTEHRRLPPRPPGEGDTGSGVAFLWGTFLWRLKERYLGCRAETRPPPLKQACGNPRDQAAEPRLHSRAHIPAPALKQGAGKKPREIVSPATEPRSTKPAAASTPPPTSKRAPRHCANARLQAPAQGSRHCPPCPHRSPTPAAYAAPTGP